MPRMACASSLIAWPPRCAVPRVASPTWATCCAASAVRCTVALICSTAEAVCCTLADCSSERCARSRLPAATSRAAAPICCTSPRTSSTMARMLRLVSQMLRISWPSGWRMS